MSATLLRYAIKITDLKIGKIDEIGTLLDRALRPVRMIEEMLRGLGLDFGLGWIDGLSSLLLSQLSPELTKNTDALAAMGKHVATLSKTMGGDATAAAEVLTTAMNQYGVSLDDPMEASRKMAEMMNIMAAAGKEGSAELPAIKMALQQCGMAAKAANVSFAETNAAIQVLDKAGKKGSEGGVALRNVMSTLAQGRFLPKDVREELSAAGINVVDLTDKSKTLTERLSLLKPVLADDALMSKPHGKENCGEDKPIQKIGISKYLTKIIEKTRVNSFMKMKEATAVRENSRGLLSISSELGTDSAMLYAPIYGESERMSREIYRERIRESERRQANEQRTRFVTNGANSKESGHYVRHEELRDEMEEILLDMLE